MSGPRSVHLFVASAGNEFMRHIAELLAEGFAAESVPCAVHVDDVPDVHSRSVQIVIAPHEYFPLFFLRTRPTIELAPTLASAFVLTAEQPGSITFEAGWEFVRRARGVFDISADGVAELSKRGCRAIHTPLGYAPSLEAPEQRPAADRPLDVVFFGHASPRREAFFARHAETFARWNCRLVLADPRRPRQATTPGYVAAATRLQLAADSRIVLNVHAGGRAYFEQHRALLAFANGALLVTERSRHTDPFRPGEHFMAGALTELPALCHRFLTDPAALAQMTAHAYETARGAADIRASCRRLLVAATGSADPTADLTAAADERARAAALQRLADSRARRERGDVLWTISTNRAWTDGAAPAISIIVTVFNYERYIRQCLASVAASEPVPGRLEVVVVDDGSTDGSREAIGAFMADSSMPVQFVRKVLNTGPADARNVALEQARGRWVFVLDADNWLYPAGLRVLHHALSSDGHAAAYGVIARFEEDTGDAVGLISRFAWSVRELVRAPYIDAMALFDRQALLEAGGYSTELIEHGWFGWEDYDLWLKLAQAGKSCLHVPHIVAGYRDHGGSMLERTNRSSAQLARYFGEKFRALADRFPDLDMRFGLAVDAPTHESSEALEIRTLREHVERLERQIAGLRASASWRVTAPLRRLGGWLHGRSSA